MTPTPNCASFEAHNLPTKHVTVYGDRAEVNKIVKVLLKRGSNEICVQKLSRSLDSDSIRVEGYGKATISEVKYQEKRVVKDDEVKEKEKELHERVKKLKEERKVAEQNLDRSKKQKEVLDGIANQLGRGVQGENQKKKDDSTGFPLFGDTNALENLEKFLNYYEKRSDEIDKSLNELNDKLNKLNEEINVAENSLSDTYRTSCSHSKEVTIFVTTTEDGEAVLDLFYVVCNASWKPSYDIRVQTDDPAMKVTYYGLIEQDTDEDWENAKLTLSTATPRVGGQVPELTTTKVGFYKPPAPRRQSPPVCDAMPCSAAAAYSGRSFMVQQMAEYESAPRMSFAQAAVKENVTSTAFEIENATTIPSDNSSHKVTIAIVDLKPVFEYETVPSKSTYAYFKAKAANTSPYPFLAGPTAIFVNQNFVANGSMKSVNAAEHFDVSLGVDPSVKVEYKAARKFNEESGLLTKSALLTHEQKIGLHNTKAEAVRVTVLEPLPQSTEEKLKVNLLEPVLNKGDKAATVTLNKHNNIEWQLTLPPNEKKELVLKYQIEHPKGEQLEYKEE